MWHTPVSRASLPHTLEYVVTTAENHPAGPHRSCPQDSRTPFEGHLHPVSMQHVEATTRRWEGVAF
jgi:hypothetical protein